MTLQSYYLDWDSRFLGFPVGKILFTNFASFEELCALIQQSSFRLIYLYDLCRGILPEKIREYNNFYQVDTKVTFEKKIEKVLESAYEPFVIQTYSYETIPQQLYELAILAGQYSRFLRDPKLGPSIQQALYRRWLENSLQGSYANQVWVATYKTQIVGFCTLQVQENCAQIGLIAVSPAYQKQGIGKKLLQTAENWCAQQPHLTTLSVVTQQENLNACRLYEKYGFQLASVVPIYHVWRY
ncbi:MAG: GNAT family N-acetyltransferase [Cytophagales bacterium]|nr:GNAT family N-acetyltransferase [Cytophagales bacterium]MDW8383330.1 GNAT family N-acetyltransferase [Flammeovirgaceae bacterium]